MELQLDNIEKYQYAIGALLFNDIGKSSDLQKELQLLLFDM